MTKEKLKKINESLTKSNDAFKKATKDEKRVLIAKDVLEQIKANRYIAESGTWLQTDCNNKIDWNRNNGIDANKSIQKLFADKTIETCHVCALGGLFMSCTNLNNNTTVSDFNEDGGFAELGKTIYNGDKLSNGLNTIFNNNQLKLIESYFENGEGWFGEHGVVGTRVAASKSHIEAFTDKYPHDDDRLIKIMENIVANNGTFVPSKLKVAKD